MIYLSWNISVSVLLLQEEVAKVKRLQSVGELPGLLPVSTSLHSRPSIGGLCSSDTIDADDGTAPYPVVQLADTLISKSPVNVSNGKCFPDHFNCDYTADFLILLFYIIFR